MNERQRLEQRLAELRAAIADGRGGDAWTASVTRGGHPLEAWAPGHGDA